MNKITGRGKIILYAASGMGVNLLNTMMASYLCSALLTGGFGEAAIPYQTFEQTNLVIPGAFGLWAIMALIAKIIDGVIDVPMASISDNLRTRFGRRRPAILIGLVGVIFFYTMFTLVTPIHGQMTVLNTVYYGVILCLFYTTYTLTMVSYYATFTEFLENERDRNLVSNAKSVFDIFYFIIGYVLVAALLKGLNIRIVAMIVLPLSLLMLIPIFMIKEKDLRADPSGVEVEPKINIFKSLGYTFKNRDFIIWMLVYSIMTFGVQLFLGGINEYFSKTGMSMMIVMACSFAPVPFTLLIYNKILKKYGFAIAFRYTLLTYAFGMTAMYGVANLAGGTAKTVLAVVVGLISSLSIGSLFAVSYSVPSQLAADEEARTGQSNSAMYFAVQGLFSAVAAGIATGPVLTGLKGSGEGQSAIVYMTLICAAAMLVSFAMTFILPGTVRGMGKEKKDK